LLVGWFGVVGGCGVGGVVGLFGGYCDLVNFVYCVEVVLVCCVDFGDFFFDFELDFV
jgi:hypothetical protein